MIQNLFLNTNISEVPGFPRIWKLSVTILDKHVLISIKISLKFLRITLIDNESQLSIGRRSVNQVIPNDWGKQGIDSLKIKMPSYQHNTFHYKNKTVSQPFHLGNGNSHTRKVSLYTESGPTWWRHQIEKKIRVTGHLYGEFTVPGDLPAQRPVARSFDVFFWSASE